MVEHINNSHYDVIVVGAGPAGCVTAQWLKNKGHRVLLIYLKHNRIFNCGESLSPHVNPIIKRLGLTSLVNESKHQVCTGNCSAFGSSQLAEHDFFFSPYGQGWHLNRERFNRDLLSLCQENHVTTLEIKKFELSQNQAGYWNVQLLDLNSVNKNASTRFIVDATGRNANVLKQLKVPTTIFDRLAARCMVYHRKSDNDRRTLIESVKNGWWYSAQIPDDKHIIMFFSDTDLSAYKRLNSSKNFQNEVALTTHISQVVDNNLHIQVGNVHSFCAQSTQAKKAVGSNWIAVGDAAICYDPLSSQGIWQALIGAEMAAKHLHQLICDQGQLGPQSDYQKWINNQSIEYHKQRHQYYSQEIRWKNERFWNRRHLFCA